MNIIVLFYAALFDQVRKKQSALIDGLHLDGKLLAQINERGLLTEDNFSAINAQILGHNRRAAGTFFVNTIMIQWPLEVFENNIRLLIEALQSHSERGNQSVATLLCKSFCECGLDGPSVEDACTMCTDNS